MPFTRHLARALITIEPLLLALLLPVVLTITPRAAPLLLLIPFLWLARRLALGRFLPSTPLNGALLLLLIMVLASLWATFDLALSLPPVAGLLYGVALFYAVVSFANRSPRHFCWALAAYLILGLAVAALALFTTQWKSEFPLMPALLRRLPASLNTVNPNYLAGALLWIAPLPLALSAALPAYARNLRSLWRR